MRFFKLSYRLNRNQCNWHFYCSINTHDWHFPFLSVRTDVSELHKMDLFGADRDNRLAIVWRSIWHQVYVRQNKVRTSIFLLTLIRRADDVFDTAPGPPLCDSGNVDPLETAIISEGCRPTPLHPPRSCTPVVALREGQVWAISHWPKGGA